MQKTYSITEMKRNFSTILNNLGKNDIIIITKFGKAVAKIIPYMNSEAK